MSTPPSPGGPPVPGMPLVLAGRYELEGKIAAGGMGEVWRAMDNTLGRAVAVKLLRPEYASDESFLVRFRGEARHAARLSHPGVASVYDYGEVQAANGRPIAYLVMELVEGEPLSALLHRERRLSAEQTLDILGQAAGALQAAHAQGVVHRDVKPGNLLVRTDGVVKVTDFGIARAMDAAPLTATGIMMGTAYYVSPEQASGKPVTPASDVYSLGVVAYECLAGRRPFDDRNPIVVVLAHQSDTPPPLPADIPAPVRALVTSAMEKSPARRPPSAGDFARTAMGIRSRLWNGPGGAPLTNGSHDAVPTTGRRRGGRRGGGSDSPAGGGALVPAPGRSPVRRTGPPTGADGDVAPWDREWDAVPARPATAAYQPGGGYDGPTAYADGAGFSGAGPGGIAEDATRYANGTVIQSGSVAPRPGFGRAGRSGRRRAGSATGRRLSVPVLVALLVATIVVTALITRTLAGGGSSGSGGSAGKADGAHAPVGVMLGVDGTASGGTARGGTGSTQGGRGD